MRSPKDLLDWSDATLRGFSWHENGHDLVISMEFLSGVGRRSVRFTWDHAHRIDLRFAGHEVGEPMFWIASIDRKAVTRHSIHLYFAYSGHQAIALDDYLQLVY